MQSLLVKTKVILTNRCLEMVTLYRLVNVISPVLFTTSYRELYIFPIHSSLFPKDLKNSYSFLPFKAQCNFPRHDEVSPILLLTLIK